MPPLEPRPTQDKDLINETSKDFTDERDNFWTHFNDPVSEMVQNEEANTDYTELMEGVDESQDVEFYEHTQTRRSGRTRKRINRYKTEEISLILHVENNMTKEQINETITKAITDEKTLSFYPNQNMNAIFGIVPLT